MLESLLENRKKNISVKIIFFFALGMTSTMPIVGVNLGSRDFSLFKIFFSVSLVYVFFRSLKNGFAVKFASKSLQLWLLLGLFSCICGSVFLVESDPEWSAAAASSMPHVILFLLFSVLWNSIDEDSEMNRAVVYGFFYGCLANCVWAIVDAAGYYLFGMSLSNEIFSGYVSRNGIRYGSLSLVSSAGGFIRSGGFNYDPAHIGFIAPIVAGVAMLSKKYWCLLIACGAILASASTTALISSIVVVVLTLSFFKIEKTFGLKHVNSIVILCVVLFIVYYYFGDAVSTFVDNSSGRFFERIDESYMQKGMNTSNIRIGYLQCLPYAIFEVIPFFLLGTGFGTASLGYARSSYAYGILGEEVMSAYDMENTYIAYLLDTGILGFSLFIAMMCILFRYSKKMLEQVPCKENIVVYSTVLASIVTFNFYHYILFAPQMLMFVIALSMIDRNISNGK